MPTVEIKFNFDTIEESHEMEQLMNYYRSYSVIQEIKEFIRSRVKYSEDRLISYEDLQKEFNNILEENKIDI